MTAMLAGPDTRRSRVRTDFPRDVREVEHFWIPLSDGTALGARMWLPTDAESNPIPAILEFLPYRKDDVTAPRDAEQMYYLAGFGYAGVRVDIRGSGSSPGVLEDEYTTQEITDAVEVIAWLAAQPWCTGNIGMMGLSWGGINSLQVAAQRPPGLKAIIVAGCTDDVYEDDIHYLGGCLLKDNLWWASTMLLLNARPPDPLVVGDRWRDMWIERMEKTPPFIERWLAHQRRDDQWKRVSVCEDYRMIDCPVYLVGGWGDSHYLRPVFRLLEHLDVPRQALIGPWGHQWPHEAPAGAAVGFLQEAVRWWDRWLKGADNCVDSTPMLRVWLQESPAAIQSATPNGRWIAEERWPSPNIHPIRYYPNQHQLLDQTPAVETAWACRSPLTAGISWPTGIGYGPPAHLDQREEDGRSICFTSPPLERRVEVLGLPEVHLDLAADRPRGLVAVRLCDVTADGSSHLVTLGLLNLTHRHGHERLEAVIPGERHLVVVRLLPVGYSFLPGHRLRLAISSASWRTWPSPEPVTLTIHTGGNTYLELPVRAERSTDDDLVAFDQPETAPPLELALPYGHAHAGRQVLYDSTAQRHEVQSRTSQTTDTVRTRLRYGPDTRVDIETVSHDLPLTTVQQCRRSLTMSRDGWSVRVEAESVLTSDADHFLATNALEAYEADVRVFTKTWTSRIPRDLT